MLNFKKTRGFRERVSYEKMELSRSTLPPLRLGRAVQDRRLRLRHRRVVAARDDGAQVRVGGGGGGGGVNNNRGRVRGGRRRRAAEARLILRGRPTG